MMPFHVGMKVACIDAEPLPGTYYSFGKSRMGIGKGKIYEIREILIDEESGLCFHLKGIYRCDDAPLLSRHFRPVVKTDISILTALLETQPQKETV